MRFASSLFLLAAACGGAATSTETTAPENAAPPEGERLAAPEAPDPSQICDVFSTIRLALTYDGECGGPPTIELEYNPTGTPELAPTDGTSELATTSFAPQGCAIQGTWMLGMDEVALDVYATGPNQIGGTATWRAGDAECPARITGSWETWASD